MSDSHKDGHGRCGACGDDGESRRAREAAWQHADECEREFAVAVCDLFLGSGRNCTLPLGHQQKHTTGYPR